MSRGTQLQALSDTLTWIAGLRDKVHIYQVSVANAQQKLDDAQAQLNAAIERREQLQAAIAKKKPQKRGGAGFE